MLEMDKYFRFLYIESSNVRLQSRQTILQFMIDYSLGF
jgi:hypothetical protein